MKVNRRIAATIAASALLLVTAGWSYRNFIVLPRIRAPLLLLLKDPSSAQFAQEVTTKAGGHCGLVNAKNGIGGYFGFTPFIITSSRHVFLEDALPLPARDSIEDSRTRSLTIQIDLLERQKAFSILWDTHCK